jgi:pseudaminic acid biosynthesis-associated methylase
MHPNEQTKAWMGEFGTAYTERNQVEWSAREPAFRSVFKGLGISSALEVGCNKGHNLMALRHVLPGLKVHGLEVNPYALCTARKHVEQGVFVEGSADSLPFPDSSMDLCLTVGVLIHIPSQSLQRCLEEICRVSRRYVFCAEYFAEQDTEVTYRGHSNLLWKRNFLDHYLTVCPNLTLIRQDYWGPEQGFDNVTCWLMEKRA